MNHPDNHHPERDLDESATDGPIRALRDAVVRALPSEEARADALATQARRLDLELRAFVVEHPVATVACAAFAGFVIGRVLRG